MNMDMDMDNIGKAFIINYYINYHRLFYLKFIIIIIFVFEIFIKKKSRKIKITRVKTIIHSI